MYSTKCKIPSSRLFNTFTRIKQQFRFKSLTCRAAFSFLFTAFHLTIGADKMLFKLVFSLSGVRFNFLTAQKVTKMLHSIREGCKTHNAELMLLNFGTFITAMAFTIPSLTPWWLISPLWAWSANKGLCKMLGKAVQSTHQCKLRRVSNTNDILLSLSSTQR